GNFRHVPGDGVEGMAAEYVVRSANAFTHAPQGWSHEQAATITTSGLTAWRALVVNGGLKAGDVVLLQGTGGVSITALRLTHAMGGTTGITAASNDQLARAKKPGADFTGDFVEGANWGKKVRELTGGVDHVVEVGGPSTLAQSLTAINVGG